ncbi:MAG: SpoIVB peptidase [Erysipelotrichales bacterium]|nr:SpoIVB peptidase [Erysipelotrichales bacterium]
MKLLFSFLSILSVMVSGNHVMKSVNIVPGGQNIGIEIKPGGLMVSGTYDIKYEGKTYNPSSNSDIQKGDIIYKANDAVVQNVDDFVNIFSNSPESNDIKLSLKRNGKFINRTLHIVRIDNRFKTGLFVKERLLGIGTISFYDENTKMYGALGHEISDNSSSDIIEVDSGSIYDSTVTSITPSINSKPGEKIADIDFNDYLGNVLSNTNIGIYGKYETLPTNSSSLPLAEIEEVHLGKAEMWTVVKGDEVTKYQIEITKVNKQNEIAAKGISFKVTDERLLKVSNGIVAGMSGSPIIQNGKVVAAVTHVLVDKVESGYGVYMRWMFDMANTIYEQYYG